MVDLEASVDGEVLEDGVASGVSYTIGSGQLLDGIDEAVIGLEKGGSATFASELKGGSAPTARRPSRSTSPTSRAVNCPTWTTTSPSSPPSSTPLRKLRADSRKRLERMKSYDQATQAQEKVLDALIELVEVPIPEKLLKDEIETRTHNLEHHQFPGLGLTWETYLEREGKTREEYDAELEAQAVKGIKTQFILDELVNKEKLSVNQEELTEHLMRRAATSGMTPDQFAQAVVEGGQVPMLVGEVARGKALAAVVEAAKVTDSNGEPVDLDDDEDEDGETVNVSSPADLADAQKAAAAETSEVSDEGDADKS